MYVCQDELLSDLFEGLLLAQRRFGDFAVYFSFLFEQIWLRGLFSFLVLLQLGRPERRHVVVRDFVVVAQNSSVKLEEQRQEIFMGPEQLLPTKYGLQDLLLDCGVNILIHKYARDLKQEIFGGDL